MNAAEGVKKIEELLGEFAKEPNEVYVELLQEMVDRAETALAAHREDE